MYSLTGLKKFFRLGKHETSPKKADLLSSNESLKDFGKLWSERREDVMMMLAMLEYDFISNNNYTEDQVAAIKTILGNLAKYLRDCSLEWKEFESLQKAKQDTQIEKEENG